MKSLIIVFKYSVAITLITLICCTIMQQSVIKNELSHVTNDAMYATQRVLVDKRYPINTDEEYIAEYIQNTLRSVTSSAKYNFDVYTADHEKGILDVVVTVKFKYITGVEGSFSVRRTNLVDQITN